jgi:hypothetical protein
MGAVRAGDPFPPNRCEVEVGVGGGPHPTEYPQTLRDGVDGEIDVSLVGEVAARQDQVADAGTSRIEIGGQILECARQVGLQLRSKVRGQGAADPFTLRLQSVQRPSRLALALGGYSVSEPAVEDIAFGWPLVDEGEQPTAQVTDRRHAKRAAQAARAATGIEGRHEVQRAVGVGLQRTGGML